MRPEFRDGFEIAIICALPLEADAMEALFDENYDTMGQIYRKQPGDANSYTTGRIGQHNIVLCYMPGMGKGSAASVASSLRVSYTGIKLALVVGICGGVPFPQRNTTIFLGDVIISDSVIEYDFGRQYPHGFRRKSDLKDTLGRPTREIRTFLAGLKTRRMRNTLQERLSLYLKELQMHTQSGWHYPGIGEDVLFETSYRHKHYQRLLTANCLCNHDTSIIDTICDKALKSDCRELGCEGKQVRRDRLCADSPIPVVHIGTIASADTVMKSGEHRDKLAEMEGIIGLEMEGAGVWDNIPCVIIKGVCDYADSHKNKIWQNYAAATAASCTKTFLDYWLPTKNENRTDRVLPEQNTDIKNLKVSIDKTIAQSRTAALLIIFTFVYCQEVFTEVLMIFHTRLAKVISPWPERPAVLEDAHLRRFTIPLDTINSWEIFDFILERHFVNMPGYQKVKNGSYILEDSITHKEVRHTSAFNVCFRPGRQILMSVRLHHTQHEKSSCPSCHAVNLDSGRADVCCSICGLQYRRITEIFEEDRTPASVCPSTTVSRKASLKARPLVTGPETLAESDIADEDVTEFKRVQIVVPPDVTEPVDIGVDETAIIWPASRLAATSFQSLANLSYKAANGATYTGTFAGTESRESYASNRRRRRAERARV